MARQVSLTSLHITNTQGLPSPETLIAVLRATLALETLELTGRSCEDTGSEQNIDELREDNSLPIELPNLRRMLVRSDPLFSFELFSVIAIPCRTNLQLYVEIQFSTDRRAWAPNDLSDALPAHDDLVHIGCIEWLDCVRLDVHGDTPGLTCSSRGSNADSLSMFIVPLGRPSYAGEEYWSNINRNIARALRRLRISECITYATMGCDVEAGTRLFDVFDALPKLRKLVVETPEGAFNVLDALKFDGGDPLCPDLEELQFHGLAVDGFLVVDIINCLRKRKSMGVSALQTLKLVDCKWIEEWHVKMLQEVRLAEVFCCSTERPAGVKNGEEGSALQGAKGQVSYLVY